ncbi:glycosyltransferase [Curtobacterium sp. MCBA15_004]|uniref:glycosyltransferase n=1 Tax=unclassified Curtobacterium TaxID=257496 RepID=UPI001587CEF7|nr:glycosyltransferase [Curtobacterium sp. MCBA15_004]WIA97410.1 glycosyltransferase [Curtobacterium sp. MCBA15_004]
MWEALSARADLTVALLESDEQRRREGRRGNDWRTELLTTVRHRTLRTLKFRRGETSLYALIDPWPLLRRRPDAVLLGGWESPAYWQLLLLARLGRVRAVGFYESTLHTNRFRRGVVAAARAWYLRQLDGIVVPGIAAEQALLAFGVSPNRIFRGFNAVDVSKIASRAERSCRERSGHGGHTFLFVGQLIERKQPDVLLRAFASIRQPSDVLRFVGDGELRAELEIAAKQLGVAHQVIFSGVLDNDDTIDAMVLSDTLVLPSVEEVWGLVVNEALAAGMHVVVSKNSGVAASTATMRGVYITEPNEVDLTEVMTLSREEWTGRIRDPEVLAHTPDAFADVFLQALSEGRPRALFTSS